MEIPTWLNPFGLAYELGRKAGEKLANSPRAAVMALGIALDVQEGRSLSRPYRFNPLKDAVRAGFVNAAVSLMEERIRGVDPETLSEFFQSSGTE